MEKMTKNEIIQILKNGGIGVLPTDTLYGLVGRALVPETVARIYRVRKRSPEKPLIILISSVNELELFGVSKDREEVKAAQGFWPGKVSIILPCHDPKFEYLHRGTNTLAFRLPDKPDLLELLKETGPLAAPSANPEGEPPALTAEEAKKYFGSDADFYDDVGIIRSEPSAIIKITGNKIDVIRGNISAGSE
ncbi:MAG: L-threonylcarbamoyladenylate synthase [Candidatus Pacebacteria bacterium]|nr:L-threonylcarbamoyladenylate synthase [Candidatus Paceibacterota bacterium]